MSVEPTVVQICSLDDAVEEIWRSVLAGEHRDVAAAARALFPTIRLPREVLDDLALRGLIDLARHEQRGVRNAASPRSAIGYGAPKPGQWESYIALTWPRLGADGAQRQLLFFTLPDLAALAVASRRASLAYARTATWASSTEKLLVEYGAPRVCDLPPAVLAQVEADALEAMGRQT